SANALATEGGRAPGGRVGYSDVDDHHAALALLARWRHLRSGSRVSVPLRYGKLGTTPLAFAAPFLFFLEDLFNNPGIQHGGPPFKGDRGSSLTTYLCVAPIVHHCNPRALRR